MIPTKHCVPIMSAGTVLSPHQRATQPRGCRKYQKAHTFTRISGSTALGELLLSDCNPLASRISGSPGIWATRNLAWHENLPHQRLPKLGLAPLWACTFLRRISGKTRLGVPLLSGCTALSSRISGSHSTWGCRYFKTATHFPASAQHKLRDKNNSL